MISNQLFKIIFNYYLRPTQIISVLFITRKERKLRKNSPNFNWRRKTALIITLAAVNMILGHKVDIVTISEILAKRDAENKKTKKFMNP